MALDATYVAKPASMKALPKRKGNLRHLVDVVHNEHASMKALPKRKGNNQP